MRGAIAAGHTVTAEAGARVLEAGGNAVDACLAAALASWVAESPLTGPGGGGFGLVYLARDASTRVYDFFAAIPSERRGAMDEVVVDFADASTQRFHVGEASCAVPGTVPGLEAIHRAHATIPWRELVAPAAALARAGVELTPSQTFLHEILDSTLRRTPEGRAVYPPPRAGDTLRLPALADTLDRLAVEGSSAMPDLLDGLLPRRDLEAYRVSVRRPVETSFLGRRFLSNPPPSSGGVLIAYGLALLDRLGLGGPAGSAAAAARLVEVMREQQRARGRRLTRRLLAEATLNAAAARLTGTTHVSVIDAEGNVAALSASSGSGSGVICRRLPAEQHARRARPDRRLDPARRPPDEHDGALARARAGPAAARPRQRRLDPPARRDPPGRGRTSPVTGFRSPRRSRRRASTSRAPRYSRGRRDPAERRLAAPGTTSSAGAG